MTTRTGTGKNKKVYYYYQCTTAAHSGADSCKSRQIKSDDIELMTVELIRKTGSEKGYLEAIIKDLTKSNQDNIDKLNTEYVNLGSSERKLERDQQRLAKLAASNVNVSKMSGVVKELEDLQQQIDDIANRQKEISAIVEQLKSEKVDVESIKILYQEFDQIWDNLEKIDKRNILNLLISEITVSIKKKAKTGKITVELVNGLPVDSLTKWTVGSSTCSVMLRRRDSNPRPGG
ncbi:MAG: hypothetical protein HQ528_03815 [Candidatus Marinimicrobia bacterium]|nr:hypothetical protein [Candidatus Neomarinimicrobiota bacterium]